ncbi:hypothetical protein NpNSSI1_00012115 [Neofusicoccum parvum]|nr:hypothetical protein NpNSSI1_00012115 [Neofusicoccum parvum]
MLFPTTLITATALASLVSGLPTNTPSPNQPLSIQHLETGDPNDRGSTGRSGHSEPFSVTTPIDDLPGSKPLGLAALLLIGNLVGGSD